MKKIHRRRFLEITSLSSVVAGIIAPKLSVADTGNQSINVKPTKAQEAWMKLKYGMFLHFGPNTINKVGWGDGKFPPEKFMFDNLNTDQWAQTAADAGMKYAVLTTKHHDGFCLWPSRYTEYSVKNSKNKKDVVGAFVESFRKKGMKVGFYYSLWDMNFPGYENDKIYAEYMRNQVAELLTNYGEITQIWFDGAWDKDFPTRQWQYNPEWEKNPDSGLKHGERWEWESLYNEIHRLQPSCIVQNNSSSDRLGQVRYFPVDARTAEHFDFIMNEKIIQPVIDPVFTNPKGEKVYLPMEYCTSLSPQWFWTGEQFFLHPSVDTIAGWYNIARKHSANFLLNVGPNDKGVIPDYHVTYLIAAAKKLGI